LSVTGTPVVLAALPEGSEAVGAVAVGGTSSVTLNVYVTGALVLPAVSLALTANRYVCPSAVVYDVGDVHGAKASAADCTTSEHWNVEHALLAVNANVAVAVIAGLGGFCVMVTTGGAALMVNANWLVLMLPAASVPCTVKVYEPSGWAAYVMGDVHGLNTGVAAVVREHWNVEPAAVEVKANVGVLLNVSAGGCCVIVTAPI